MYLFDIYKRYPCRIMFFPLGRIYKIARMSSPIVSNARMLETASRNKLFYYLLIFLVKKHFSRNFISAPSGIALTSFGWDWDSATAPYCYTPVSSTCSVFFFPLWIKVSTLSPTKSKCICSPRFPHFAGRRYMGYLISISMPTKIHYFLLLAPQWEYIWFIFCFSH